MKIPPENQQPQAGLMQLFAHSSKKSAKQPQPHALKGFDAALREEAASEEKPEEKKSAHAPHKRVSATPLEALLVSHATTSRPAAFIDTKKETVKVTAQATGDALAMRARGASHHLPTPQTHPVTAEPATRQHEGSKRAPETDKKAEETFKIAAAEAKTNAPAAPMIDAPGQPQPIASPNFVAEAAPLAPVAPMMLDDASVRAVLLPTVARVSIEAGDAGRLNVQLKVNDGVTEIRATGPAAQLLETRQGELRVALAREGLALGHFDLTQQHSHSHAQQGAESEDGAPLSRKNAARSDAGSDRVVTSDGRLHVKA